MLRFAENDTFIGVPAILTNIFIDGHLKFTSQHLLYQRVDRVGMMRET